MQNGMGSAATGGGNNNNGNDDGGDKPNRGPSKKLLYASAPPQKQQQQQQSRGNGTSQQSVGSSTQETGLMTPFTQQTELAMTNNTLAAGPARRNRMMNTVMLLGALSGSSFLMFLVLYLPFAALLALALCFSSSSFMFYFAYLWMQMWFREALNGRGLAQYLPESLRRQLTQRSLHEVLQDRSVLNDYSYLMLYFMPGLSPERLDEFVDRLPSRQRDNLRRGGLGHLMGESFMMLMLGREGYQAHIEAQRSQLPREIIPARPLSLPPLAEDDESTTSELGVNSIDSRAPNGGDNNNNETHQSRAIVVIPPPTEEERQMEEREANRILTEAFTRMSLSMAQSGVTSGANLVAAAIEMVSPTIIGSGMAVTSVAVALGLINMATGSTTMDRASSISSRRTIGLSTQTLVLSGLFGTFVAGTTYLVRIVVRSRIQSSRSDEGKKKKEE